MLDCWMAFDLEYAVRLAEELRPCKLKWMEEVLRSEELDAPRRAAPAFAMADPGYGESTGTPPRRSSRRRAASSSTSCSRTSTGWAA